jgi:hypothetical protein
MRWGAIGACLLAISCGSQGGGGGGDGSWLTFSPPSVSQVAYPPSVSAARRMGASFSIKATSSKTFAETLNVAIVDPVGILSPAIQITGSGTTYTASMSTRVDLPPGLHEGSLEIRLCYDAATVCARQVDGSPWRIPYSILVIDDAAYSFSRWATANATVPFDGSGLASIGSTLFALAPASATSMDTWQSTDEGATWNRAASGPPVRMRDFALASDGSAIFVSGGELLDGSGNPTGTYSSRVYRFDGSSWQVKTDAAPFAGRRSHGMVRLGGDLYVLGGNTATASLPDAWKSSDDGATWTRLADLPAGARQVNCAAVWNGSIAVVKRVAAPWCLPVSGSWCATGPALWTSADGATWQVRPGYAAHYLVSATHCTAVGGRLFVYGTGGGPANGGGLVSSSDLDTWRYEPMASYGETTPGMPAVNGKLFLLLGSGTTFRPAIRTEPAP